MIIIAGYARSGTSWLGKIFDSHPEVAYRHEPDSSVPCHEFPFFVEEDDYERYGSLASNYLERLCRVTTTRSVGRRPHFPKSYRSSFSRIAHLSIVSLLQVCERLPIVGDTFTTVNAAEFSSTAHPRRFVIKSVVSLGRLGLYAHIVKGHIVLLLRHPCGVVASQLRGARLGKLKFQMPLRTLVGSRIGAGYGLSPGRLHSLTTEEQLAWTWVVMNEQAVQGIRRSDNAVAITHEALCLDPVGEASRLFKECGLSWSSQTEEFLVTAQQRDRNPGFFDVNRSAAGEIEKWKRELPPEVIGRVEAILARSPLADYF